MSAFRFFNASSCSHSECRLAPHSNLDFPWADETTNPKEANKNKRSVHDAETYSDGIRCLSTIMTRYHHIEW